MSKRKYYTPGEKTRAIAALKRGESVTQTAKLMKITEATLYRWKVEGKKKFKKAIKQEHRSREERLEDAKDRMVSQTRRATDAKPGKKNGPICANCGGLYGEFGNVSCCADPKRARPLTASHTFDAIVYLENAVEWMAKRSLEYGGRPGKGFALVILALTTLKGE